MAGQSGDGSRAAGWYALALGTLVLAGAFHGLRANGLFSCTAAGYSPTEYLSYCQATKYADYDHGAIWFGLEREAVASAARADVLIVGNSRTQFGFSSDATRRWFGALPARFFLLGFSHYENYTFEAPLMKRLGAHPRAVVINIDSFWEDDETDPGRSVMRDPEAEGRYRQKRIFQYVHRPVCTLLPVACRTEYTIFRSRTDGTWRFEGGVTNAAAVHYDAAIDSAKVARYVERGQAFLPSLGIDSACVILTVVPTTKTAIGTSRAIAAGLGRTFVAPEVEGLLTFDGNHLDRASAERWSSAFLDEAGPALRRCLSTPGSSGSL